MSKQNFRMTVKERQGEEPCFLWFELHEDIGLGDKVVQLNLRNGTDIDDAERIANLINDQVISISLFD